MGMDIKDRMEIMSAIGNHDEATGTAVSDISAALILADKLFSQGISRKLKYMTLGTLFINVSIGGTLTNFAAPPILMVAQTWDWSTTFMFTTFGWKAIVAIFLNTAIMIIIFYKELSFINIRTTVTDRENIPFAIVFSHFVFLFLVVYFGHYPAFFMSIFLLFLGVYSNS